MLNLTTLISAPMFKMMYLASTLRDINEGVERIDRILAERPVPETATPRRPSSYEVQFERVSFAYGGEGDDEGGEALTDVSFVAGQGRVTALAGPSGAGMPARRD